MPSDIHKVIEQLAPKRTLRAAIYLGNFLLVSGQGSHGEPLGVSPDLAAAIANRLNVDLELVPFKDQTELVAAVAKGECGMGLVGADPARSEHITFAPAYTEIEATYLVPADSSIQSIEQVDQPTIQIASFSKSAYDLWLVRNIQHATLVHADSVATSFDIFVQKKLDALAGLRTGLKKELLRLPGSRILDGKFMSVQQGVATRHENRESIEFLTEFIREVKLNGLIQQSIDRHQIEGLTVAP